MYLLVACFSMDDAPVGLLASLDEAKAEARRLVEDPEGCHKLAEEVLNLDLGTELICVRIYEVSQGQQPILVAIESAYGD